MNYDDALAYLINYLRRPVSERLQRGSEPQVANFDLWLPNAIHVFLIEHRDAQNNFFNNHSEIDRLWPVFSSAVWDLCRLGCLRPGTPSWAKRASPEIIGEGFAITDFGRRWLEQSEHLGYALASPDRFSQMIEEYASRLGKGFQQRAVEANRAYFGGAYLAACAMCGAAAESIVLSAAVAKTGDEEKVLAEYRTANGRRKIENILIGNAPEHLKRRVSGYLDLLNYWRDEAAHGISSDISELQAHEALARVLRFAQTVCGSWAELVRP